MSTSDLLLWPNNLRRLILRLREQCAQACNELCRILGRVFAESIDDFSDLLTAEGLRRKVLARLHDSQARLTVGLCSSCLRSTEATCARCAALRVALSWTTLIGEPHGGSRAAR
jgi:hypothetical protein